MRRPLRIEVSYGRGLGRLEADLDPASIGPAVAAAVRPLFLSVGRQLPTAVLDATARALERHPEVELGVFELYATGIDASMAWLEGFEHIQHLSLTLSHATSFDVLAGFTQLRSLHLGGTGSKEPTLEFLRQMPHLCVLSLEAAGKGFEAVGDVPKLTRLQLRIPRVKSLECLRGHPNLEMFGMDFGGIRDLSPVSDAPKLRGLQLYQVRKFDTDDLEALSGCKLQAVSLGGMRNITRLRALARGSRETLRFLNLDRMTGLETLADLTACSRLEQLGLYDARPADKRLHTLLAIPSLRYIVAGDAYPRAEREAMKRDFDGEVLFMRGEPIRGKLEDVAVSWRASVEPQLDRIDQEARETLA